MSSALLWVYSFREVPEEPSKGVGTVVIPASESPWWGAALRAKGVTAAMGGGVSMLLNVLRGTIPH